MNKRTFTERDICMKFNLPAVRVVDWNGTQIGEQVFIAKDRIIFRDNLVTQGKAKKADNVLFYEPNLAIVLDAARDNNRLEASATDATRRRLLDVLTEALAPYDFREMGATE